MTWEPCTKERNGEKNQLGRIHLFEWLLEWSSVCFGSQHIWWSAMITNNLSKQSQWNILSFCPSLSLLSCDMELGRISIRHFCMHCIPFVTLYGCTVDRRWIPHYMLNLKKIALHFAVFSLAFTLVSLCATCSNINPSQNSPNKIKSSFVHIFKQLKAFFILHSLSVWVNCVVFGRAISFTHRPLSMILLASGGRFSSDKQKHFVLSTFHLFYMKFAFWIYENIIFCYNFSILSLFVCLYLFICMFACLFIQDSLPLSQFVCHVF